MSTPPPPPPPPGNSGPGMPGPGMSQPEPPDNYLVWSILTTLLCCLPTGVYAIVLSAGVNERWHSGRHAEAIERSQQAKKWAIITAVLGIIAGIGWIVIYSIIGAAMFAVDG